jgi:hypothetical protein
MLYSYNILQLETFVGRDVYVVNIQVVTLSFIQSQINGLSYE